MSTESRIIDNLKTFHHGKWVNPMCAIRGMDSSALSALRFLVSEGVVKRKTIPVPGYKEELPLYRYTAPAFATRVLELVDSGEL